MRTYDLNDDLQIIYSKITEPDKRPEIPEQPDEGLENIIPNSQKFINKEENLPGFLNPQKSLRSLIKMKI